MKRSSAPPLQFLAAVAPDTSAMSSRFPYRGGRKQGGRAFSDSPYNGDGGDGGGGGRGQQFVTGDSHFRSVSDANLGFHRGGDQGFSPRPPPRRAYAQSQQFRQPPPYNQNKKFRQRPLFDQDQNQNQNQRFQQAPPFYQNQAFGSPRQFRPRPSKPLDYRAWQHAKTAPPPNSEKFIVLSYNILADYLAINHRSKLYFHIPRHMLDWEWRKRNILFELGLWSADIMCLQEVDRFQDLEEELKQRGYSGIWKMRTGNAIDGCAVFWRTSRFKLCYEESFEFNKFGLRDNVAQICVLQKQLTSQNYSANTSALPASSTDSNKVVICNIHVLYNPKRGEIKLGQVRLLLERAHAVSKIWNGARVVICGDFNCTPKSPLYDFISEQKLDLSGVARDKVSGQASAEIRALRPHNSSPNPNSDSGTLSSDKSVQAPLMVDNKLGDFLPDMQEQNGSGKGGEISFTGDYSSQPQCSRTVLDASDLSSVAFQCNSVDGASCIEEMKDTQQNVVDSCKDGTRSAISVFVDSSVESPTMFLGEDEKSVVEVNDEIHKSTSVTSHCGDAYPNWNDMEWREKANSTSSSNQALSCDDAKSSINAENRGTNLDILSLSLEDSPPGSSRHLLSQSIVDDEDSGLSTHYQASVSSVSTSVYDLEGRITSEDQSTFLSALNDMNDAFPPDYGQNARFDLDQSTIEFASNPDNSQLHSPSPEVLDDFSLGLDSEVLETAYDPSSWTPMETATATGNADSTIVEHPLKLKSTYTEVEDCSGTRDLNGEPLVTSYNRCFLGTVDYIWCSEGLRTVRVLAPIPKHAMQWTPGFPTKKWGSDHIALASELAFIEDATDNSVKVQ